MKVKDFLMSIDTELSMLRCDPLLESYPVGRNGEIVLQRLNEADQQKFRDADQREAETIHPGR